MKAEFSESELMDLLRKIGSGECGRRTGILKRRGLIRIEITDKGKRALKEHDNAEKR